MLRIIGVFFCGLVAAAEGASHEAWRPITPEELALKESKIDANADAEALFREVWLDQYSTTTYVRFKIFNDRGREKYSDVKVEYSGKYRVSDVRARTIHADGTIVEVDKKSMLEKVEIKKGGLKVKVLSFAMPSVERGSIVEYRWTESDEPTRKMYLPLEVQSEYPADEVTFHVKPQPGSGFYSSPFRFMGFGCRFEEAKMDSRFFWRVTLHNVPAYHDEPFSPPRLATGQWVLGYYSEKPPFSGDSLWQFIGKIEYQNAQEQVKLNGEMKRVAQALIVKGKTEDEQLALLADYCRKNIRNVDGSEATIEEREEFKPNKSTIDTFNRQVGTAHDIELTFIALAQAAGFRARLALVADRHEFLFTPQLQSGFFLNNYDAAVKVDGGWKFYDASDPWAPPGELSWREQGVYALIPDRKKSEWAMTPLLTAKETKFQRLGDFTLSAGGDLEGDVRELYWGNAAFEFRWEHASQNAGEREEFVKSKWRQVFADAEVTQISVTISENAAMPAGIKYHLRVKNYGERTGRRLLVRASLLQSGEQAYFTSADRKNDIYFHYPWSEWDTVSFRLPQGFQLDHAAAPASVTFAPAGQYSLEISSDRAKNTLDCQRSLVVSANGKLLLPVDQYAHLKDVFDKIHSADEQVIVFTASPEAARK